MNEQIIEEISSLQNEEVENLETDVTLTDSSGEEVSGSISTQEKKPEDVAAVFFSMNQRKLHSLLEKLSAKQLRRVIFNACSYPFVDKAYMPRTDEEKGAAYLVHEMTLNKTIMQLSFEMQKAEEALQKENETGTIKKENVEGVNND